ncbi:WG repeat-containing protein [Motilimonas pumila]|uniref:WG repeat-containing protein n=1 Tax=Motilimonas pumila TaxID=2303987 RepID=A0A418YEJ1_9GAMM|nr:WG repeat-containing protein [Motilimonas pumila]RJG47518.1 WG repeat-containing protein [Motilimonas pumila]
MSRYVVSKNGKFGFIDQAGGEVIPLQFDMAGKFNEGVAWVVITQDERRLSGFIDEAGEWVIEPIFSADGWHNMDGSLFSEGVAGIQADNNKMMYINRQGEPICEPIYDQVHPFCEGRGLVCRDGLYGYIDSTGQEVITCQFAINNTFPEHSYFSHGKAMVRFNIGEEGLETSNNFGCINKQGQTVFDPEDNYANAYKEGFSMVGDGHNYYFIDEEGQVPFERTTRQATSFSQGLADFLDFGTGLFGYIDKTGEWVIKPQFKSTFRFTEGLAVVHTKYGKSKGCINLQGELVIEGDFKIILPFENGLAKAHEQNKSGYINKQGDYVWSTAD